MTVDMVDELGEPGQRKLILELQGRRSNLILTDGEIESSTVCVGSIWR